MVKKSGRILLAFTACACWASDRPVAEWILRQGGRIIVEGDKQPISRLSDLPAADFRIATVDLVGTLVAPEEIQRLAPLDQLRELLLP